MTRYALNLPNNFKRDAERLAKKQGVSLDQFILWSVAEKVGELLRIASSGKLMRMNGLVNPLVE